MKNKKIMVSLCLAAVMAGTQAVPAAAAPTAKRTAQEWETLQDNTMEYGELEGLIHEYNTTVKNNRVELSKEDFKSSEEFASKYWKIANESYEKLDQLSPGTPESTRMQLEMAARQAELTAENNTTSIETIGLGYEQTEMGLVAQAQKAMVSYFQLLEQREVLAKNKELAEASWQSAQTRQSLGMATAAEVLNAQQTVQNLDSQITELESNIKSTKQKLCVMTGWSADAEPEIMPVPGADLGRLDTMNLEQDTQKALEQDYTLRINQKKLANATSMENTELLETTVSNDRQQVSVAMNTAYQAVQQAKADYDQAILDFQVAEKNMAAADQKYQMGTMSRLEYLQEQADFATAKAGKNSKEMALFQAMETYDWTVKGVRS